MEGIVEGTVGEEAVAGVVVIAEEGEGEVVVVIVEGVADERCSEGWCCGFEVLGLCIAYCTFTATWQDEGLSMTLHLEFEV